MKTSLKGGMYALLFACVAAMGTTVQAHFIWLVPERDQQQVQVYFGEDASPDDPALLRYVDGMQAWSLAAKGKPTALKLKKTDEALTAPLAKSGMDSVYLATHDLGVMERGGSKFRLQYYAKSGPDARSDVWKKVKSAAHLKLDVIPAQRKQMVVLQVRFNGKPAEGAEVNVAGPGMDDFDGKTDAKGRVKFRPAEAGLYSIRAKVVEEAGGELDGKAYDQTRHYSTLAVHVPVDSTSKNSSPAGLGNNLQPLSQPVTSFGAAVLDDHVYIYGGHLGDAHSYSKTEQGDTLHALNLKTGAWKDVAKGPHLQGLALVACEGKLYRIGGFAAKNAAGEEHDLWSQADVACFDPSTKTWTEMPSLPEPRSSFDAAVLGKTIYVVGGWKMAGEGDSVWHKTAWALDVSAEQPEWKALPEPPFQRRALATAVHDGKLYAIGGMQQKGGPTRAVHVFDPKSAKWSEGPELIGEEGITGFGASAFATGGRLYVSTIKGDLQRLSKDGKRWEMVRKTPTARFFHRLLPLDPKHLLVVGGANMGIGKFEEVEILSTRNVPDKPE